MTTDWDQVDAEYTYRKAQIPCASGTGGTIDMATGVGTFQVEK